MRTNHNASAAHLAVDHSPKPVIKLKLTVKQATASQEGKCIQSNVILTFFYLKGYSSSMTKKKQRWPNPNTVLLLICFLLSIRNTSFRYSEFYISSISINKLWWFVLVTGNSSPLICKLVFKDHRNISVRQKDIWGYLEP